MSGTIPNTYDVESFNPTFSFGLKQRVSFREVTMDGEIVPPPSPQLLALHAACAKVAHLSGAAEHLYDVFDDPDADCMVSISLMTQTEAPAILTKKTHGTVN